MEALLKLLLILLVVCVLLWCGQIWGLWFIAQGGLLGVTAAVFTSIGTWLAGLTFWQALAVVGLACILIDPESTIEVIKDVGDAAGEAATAVGEAVGGALAAVDEELGFTSKLMWIGGGILAFFLFTKDDSQEKTVKYESKDLVKV